MLYKENKCFVLDGEPIIMISYELITIENFFIVLID